MPSRPLLFLYRLARVHQQDRSSSLTCYPSAHSERAIQVHPQGRAIQVHTQAHAIQVHTQERAIQVHTQNVQVHTQGRAIQVLTQERAIQVHGMLVHPSFVNCRVTSRCLAVRTSYSCTQAHLERAIQVHSQERAIQVHTQERAIQVHTQERAIQVSRF